MTIFTAPDGTQLFYQDEGQGKPVLALSGLTRNSTDFDYVAPHLRGVRLIRLDYRGRGASAWADPSTYTIPTEATDAIALLDHLGLEQAAILGTSRGGLIAMGLAATAGHRLSGAFLNDIGPEIADAGMSAIKDYIGRNPAQKTYAEAVAMRASLMAGFEDVPETRWRDEVEKHYREGSDGLEINYDPRLRDAVLAAANAPAPDLWPFFEALSGRPLAALRGANSNLLSPATFSEMQRRIPEMICAEVPGRGHVPFLDEPASLDLLTRWIEELP